MFKDTTLRQIFKSYGAQSMYLIKQSDGRAVFVTNGNFMVSRSACSGRSSLFTAEGIRETFETKTLKVDVREKTVAEFVKVIIPIPAQWGYRVTGLTWNHTAIHGRLLTEETDAERGRGIAMINDQVWQMIEGDTMSVGTLYTASPVPEKSRTNRATIGPMLDNPDLARCGFIIMPMRIDMDDWDYIVHDVRLFYKQMEPR